MDNNLKIELEFPLDWDGTVIAHDDDTIRSELGAKLRYLGFDVPVKEKRSSRQGKYVSFKIKLIFQDRAMMERTIGELDSLSAVKFIL